RGRRPGMHAERVGEAPQGPAYHLITFGCQMNQHDSEVMGGMLEAMGYRPVDTPEQADLVLINTCCVRGSAEERAYGRIGQLKALKEKRPGLVLAVAGCMVQQDGAARALLDRHPHVDLVLGTFDLPRLPELVARAAAGERVEAVSPGPVSVEAREGLPAARAPGVRAWVNITYGCDNLCSYCVVPLVRGPQRSRRLGDIVCEVEGLVERGFKEVTLLGQNVNAYGRDLPGSPGLADLLTRLNRVPGLLRIRFTTSHPRDFTPKLVEAIAGLDKVCEHFHLPAQAGSNRVLALMNRGYDREHYLSLVAHIRRVMPLAGVTTDLMVGFPGEGEEDFQDTLDLVRRAEFDAAFTFIYSPRPRTPAAGLEGQVPHEVKQERLERLMAVQYPISLARNQALVGSEVEVLVEGPSA
ncbi:MAG: tRNA (N6-isopentenyl adenosine(37)-C2)-methylthiotransferase MiaB, partial [Acetobacteraceae bacterium]|nr:tRNA (N6-isopentenyl adenosine(37)-C2)-methylthiotransferase MiaB [Acetobacteraceae bacterium]